MISLMSRRYIAFQAVATSASLTASSPSHLHFTRMSSSPPDATQLVLASRAGDRDTVDRLFALLYEDLRRAAHKRLLRHHAVQTLSTTALVHEAYLRLVDQSRLQAADRAHFLAVASRAMRFVLIDYVRERHARKRGGGQDMVPLDAVQVAAEERAVDLLALDDALRKLSSHSPRLGELVEYRFFGGLSYEEVAEATGMSVPTVKRDWVRARTWLFRAMQDAGDAPEFALPVS